MTIMCLFSTKAGAQIAPSLPPQITNWEFQGTPADNLTIKKNQMIFAISGGYLLTYVGPYMGTLEEGLTASSQPQAFKITGETIKPSPNAAPGFEPDKYIVFVPSIDDVLHKEMVSLVIFETNLPNQSTDTSNEEAPTVLTYEQP
jgi:hypothetical protein